jgi:hypothetical protein
LKISKQSFSDAILNSELLKNISWLNCAGFC